MGNSLLMRCGEEMEEFPLHQFTFTYKFTKSQNLSGQII